MLTRVILEGPMGETFGREWSLEVDSPNAALRLIDANRPGVFTWIRNNLKVYDRYRVVCEYEDGRIDELDNDTYGMHRTPAVIRFVPLIEGGSAAVRAVIGVVLIVVGVLAMGTPFAPASPYLFAMGASMLLGSVIEALSPKPKKKEESERSDKTSYYFDGPVNTTAQGVPVPPIYGRILTGSHTISASLTIDQLINPNPPPAPAPPPEPPQEEPAPDPWGTQYAGD